MNIKRLVLLFSIALAISLRCSAEEPAPLSHQSLLEKLRSDDFDERQNACAELIKRADAVRELVGSELSKSDIDADYKLNLKAVVAGIAEMDILKPIDAPKRIDLEVANESVESVLKKISDAFGQVVTARGNSESKKITLVLKQKTFMESVDAVRRAAGLRFFPTYTTVAPAVNEADLLARFKNLSLASDKSLDEEVVATSGPFAVSLFRNHPPKYAGFNLNSVETAMGGSLYCQSDIVITKARITQLKATALNQEFDELARANEFIFQRFWSGNSPANGSFFLGFSAVPRYVEDIPDGLKWKMSLTVEIPVKRSEEKFTFDPSLFGQAQSLSFGSLTIHSVSQLGSSVWNVDVSVPANAFAFSQKSELATIPEGPPFRTSVLTNSAIVLLDANGKQLHWTRTQARLARENDTGATYRLTMQSIAKPIAIVLTRTLKTATRTIDFEFPVDSRPVKF
ncbi:MAG: hypothetical protein WCT04_14000 [Planctomycetota bacterium]